MDGQSVSPPSLSLPKGGGAHRGIGEKFGADPVTGTASFSIPIPVSPGRSGFGPQLALRYDSGSGNGCYGIGWDLGVSSIVRKTEKGLPRYLDGDESDVFILSGAEDLVPRLDANPSGRWVRNTSVRDGFRVDQYRPRTEGLFSLIERWTSEATGDTHWRTISSTNITTLYGRTEESRIADPDDHRRVFRWLICESYDAKGNAIEYVYKREDRDSVDAFAPYEVHRQSEQPQRYLKRIRYGNTVPRFAAGDPETDWLFEVVLDFSDHDLLAPTPLESDTWARRPDIFSSFRAGFDIRTYRLCRRFLVFHRFPELGTEPCLVHSLDLEHESSPIATFLKSARQRSWRRFADGTYRSKALPPVDCEYSRAELSSEIRTLDRASIENAPAGVDGAGQHFVDLDGESISGLLTDDGSTWRFKPGAGGGALGTSVTLRSKPSVELSGAQLLDLAGDGSLDVATFDGAFRGFFEREGMDGWAAFTAFRSSPNLNWSGPGVKFADLTGDGHSDVLAMAGEITEWFPSLAEEGFDGGLAAQVRTDNSGERSFILGDSLGRLFFADMSGDGLADIVRIQNGEVRYWPNLGYGRFGSAITMVDAPFFDSPDLFDPGRLRLGDIDGSGVTDLIYLGRDGAQIYFNESGNGFGPVRRIGAFPAFNPSTAVSVCDLLGAGTACLVASSTLPADVADPVRYVELMSGGKPHLLVRVSNTLGLETRIRYATSTRFYLDDKAAGRPWVTRLPFPVHVTERVETWDRVSGSVFVTRYAYHHGYFDGVEREFRGFGMVEQWDTESYAAFEESGVAALASNLDESSHVPPVYSKTWFHTGAFLDGEAISVFFAKEYIGGDTDSYLLMDTILPDGLTIREEREACRALRGRLLRKEVYSLDGTEAESRPYSVAESNFTVKVIQRREGQKAAVYHVHPREALELQYDRKLYSAGAGLAPDPRISHGLTLSTDEYGNVMESVSIAYGRRLLLESPLLTAVDHDKQRRAVGSYTRNRYTNAVVEPDAYRTPLSFESSVYELVQLGVPAGRPFRFDEVADLIGAATDGSHELPSHDVAGAGVTGDGPHCRLIEQSRAVFRRDDMAGPLPLGTLESMALASGSFRLAMTPGLIESVYGGRVTDALLESEGRYVDLDGNGCWWAPGGQVFFSPAPSTPAEELALALQSFYQPRRVEDIFGAATVVTYDSHDIAVFEVVDPFGNTFTAGERDEAGNRTQRIDYRLLQPALITDANGNRSEVAFDIFGMVTGTAVMGKLGGTDGDSLDGFEPDLDEAAITAQLNDPLADPGLLLGRASARFVYDVDAFARSGDPAASCTVVRETHESSLQAGESSRIQVSLAYTDGSARTIQTRKAAEPGPDGQARWVSTGWAIFNNKGQPVRQYEPFFSPTHAFEPARLEGVSPTLLYDAAGRAVGTLLAHRAWAKTVVEPWSQLSWDAADTVLLDPAADPDVGALVRRLPESLHSPTWHAGSVVSADADTRRAAEQSAAHAGTPSFAAFDALGRVFLTVADNGAFGKLPSRVELDFEGRCRAVFDARGRAVIRSDFNLLGASIHQVSSDAGERWTLSDAAGKPIRLWDSRDQVIRIEYDALQRPVRSFADEVLFSRIVFGDSGETGLTPEAVRSANLRGKPYKSFDEAGETTSLRFDFRGTLVHKRRVFTSGYRAAPDWSGTPELAPEAFESRSEFDAVSRIVSTTQPDGTVVRVTYNQAGFIETVAARVRGAPEETLFVESVSYDAKGQRTSIVYGNGVRTDYTYDAETFRLTRALTIRESDVMQDFRYTYDACGNITSHRDDAAQSLYYRNAVVEPHAAYVYDALYRLIRAEGREHIGQLAEPQSSWDDRFRVNLPHPEDGQAMRPYVERYEYDDAGNMARLAHEASGATWSRGFIYAEANNRLVSSSVGSTAETFDYNVHGSVLALPHLASMTWDFKERLRSVDLGGGGVAFYVYDGGGNRVRKVIETQEGVRREERLSIDGFEVFRRYAQNGTDLVLERQTQSIAAGMHRVAVVEIRTGGDDGSPSEVHRYQLSNHLGSCSLELDEDGRLISFEEFHPYGTTSYQAGRSEVEVRRKRFRYTGKERDEETGLNYHGARYYAPWLGRWTSADPSGAADGANLYAFVSSNPVCLCDPNGRTGVEPATAGKSFAEAGSSLLDEVLENHMFQQSVRDAMEEFCGSRGIELEALIRFRDASPVSAPPGATGHVAPWIKQVNPRRLFGEIATEAEHMLSRGRLRNLLFNPGTGKSDYTLGDYKRDATVVWDRATALAKTKLDNAATRAGRGKPESLTNMVDDAYKWSVKAAEETGSRVTKTAIVEGIMEQTGNLFARERLGETAARLKGLAPSADDAAKVASKGLTASKAAGAALSVVGIGIDAARLATADNEQQAVQAGGDLAFGVGMLRFGPVGIIGSGTKLATEHLVIPVVEEHTDFFDYGTRQGQDAAAALKDIGIENETAGTVVGAAVAGLETINFAGNAWDYFTARR